jgi:aldehyde dehydrogenase (NAD+)
MDALADDFHKALDQDLGASRFTSDMFSLFISRKEVQNNLDNLDKWARPVSFDTPVAVGPGKSYLHKEPRGVALVISAWNYPVYTALGAVAPAIAAGNCVVLKPSEMAPATSKVLVRLFNKYLDPRYYRVVEGQVRVATAITSQPFDLIIFTGSPQKGRLVARAAAEHLTPCILELGGKSPTVVDEDADIDVAAQRIVQGRFTNSGQTCVAPDYVLAHKAIKPALLQRLVHHTKAFFPDFSDMCRIVNTFHERRIKGYLEEDHKGKVLVGGLQGCGDRLIPPTVIDSPSLDSDMMKD